jgi:hypothetical protein
MQLSDLTTTQWAVLAAAVALVVFPRLGGIKTWVAALVAKVKPTATTDTEADTIHSQVDAYRTLAPVMSPDLAKQVWACIQTPTNVSASQTEG